MEGITEKALVLEVEFINGSFRWLLPFVIDKALSLYSSVTIKQMNNRQPTTNRWASKCLLSPVEWENRRKRHLMIALASIHSSISMVLLTRASIMMMAQQQYSMNWWCWLWINERTLNTIIKAETQTEVKKNKETEKRVISNMKVALLIDFGGICFII